MAEKDDQEKTEEPTPRKLEKAKEEGNVFKSQELSSVVLLIFSSLTIYFIGAWVVNSLANMFEKFYQFSASPINNLNNAAVYLGEAFGYAARILAPVLLAMLVSGVLVNILQSGVNFTTKSMQFKPDKINPITGLKRIFSMKGLVEVFKAISKILIVAAVIFFTIRNDLNVFISLLILPLNSIIANAGYFVALVVIRILTALVILSIIDAAYQRFDWKKNLRMSKQEVKDEYKQMEGDPKIKGERRKKAMEMSQQRRLDHSVLQSDVVVTNPTHYAVALKYSPDDMDAPILMAKGMRKRALKIRELAEYYDIPIIENPPVARALYASAEVDQQVPPELYEAVAEILAYVYKLREDANAA